MTQSENTTDLKTEVLSAIESGKVKMRPKWHFVAKTALFLTGAVFATLAILYFVSLIIFFLRRSGAWFAPEFGASGWRELAFSLPWILILLSISFLAILQICITHFRFAYGRPIFYSVGAIMLVTVLGSIFVAQTPLHRMMFNQAQQNRLPWAGGLYRGYGMMNTRGNLVAGFITQISEDGLTIQNINNQLVKILIFPETKMPPKSELKIGDGIIVLGRFSENVIQAIDIKVITGETEWQAPQRPFMMMNGGQY